MRFRRLGAGQQLVLPFCILILSHVALAASPVRELETATLTPGTQSLDVDAPGLDAWLETDQKSYTPVQILQSRSPELRGSSFGYRRHPAWIRFTAINRSGIAEWRLLIHPRTLRNAELWIFDDRGNEVQQDGRVLSITPAFQFHLEPERPYTFVARLSGLEPLGLDLLLEESRYSEQFENRINLFQALYAGVLLAMIIFNSFVYRTLRERFILTYIGLLAALLILVPNINGLPDYLFNLDGVFSLWIAFSTSVACLIAHRFTQQFLRLESRFPRLNRVHGILMRIAGGISALAIPPVYSRFPEWVGQTNDVLLVTTVGTILITAINANLEPERTRSDRLFLLAWSGFLLSCVLFIGVTLGYLPNNPWTRSIVEIFNILEMLVLSFAISDRIHSIEQARISAVQKAWYADRLQKHFKMVCHDIANPLYVVLSHAQLAARGKPVNWQRVLEAVEEQQRILKYAASQSGLYPGLNSGTGSSASIQDAIGSIKLLFETLAHDKGVHLDFPPPEGCRLQVQGEPIALAHGILANALSNAMKFSEPGKSVRLRVEAGERHVILRVLDEGPGIHPEAIRELKLQGRARSRPGLRGELGTGTGFELMKFFTESFGGQFDWETGPQGTCLSFTLKRSE